MCALADTAAPLVSLAESTNRLRLLLPMCFIYNRLVAAINSRFDRHRLVIALIAGPDLASRLRSVPLAAQVAPRTPQLQSQRIVHALVLAGYGRLHPRKAHHKVAPVDHYSLDAGIPAVRDHAQIQALLERHDAGFSNKRREVCAAKPGQLVHGGDFCQVDILGRAAWHVSAPAEWRTFHLEQAAVRREFSPAFQGARGPGQ